MTKQGPSNKWELETRKILQEQLPEYDIDPHIRLANIIKGRIRFIKAMSQYEIDFTVREKETGHVVCAIELDGPTHDTEDGQRRDANKNKWLYEAGIPLIRIRKPEEAYDIRNRISETMNTITPHENIHDFQGYFQKQNKSAMTALKEYAAKLTGIIAIAGLLMWTINTVAQKALSNIGKDSMAQMQIAHKENQNRANEQQTAENWRKQQVTEQADIQQRLEVQKPHYERVLVKGKPIRECKNSMGQIDNNSLICMKDHYETVLVNAPQN